MVSGSTQPAMSPQLLPPCVFSSVSQNMTRFHMVLAVYRGCRGRRKEMCAPLARGLYTHALKIEHRTQGRHDMCSFHVLMQSPSPEISHFGRSVLFSSEAFLFLLDNKCGELGSAAWSPLPLPPALFWQLGGGMCVQMKSLPSGAAALGGQ